MLLLFGAGTLIFILVATNPFHNLHYLSVTLSPDPVRSFEAERGPVYYAYLAYVFGTMILAACVLYANYRKVGLALKRRTMIMELAVLLPLMTMTLLFPLWQFIPSEVMIITGILLAASSCSSVRSASRCSGCCRSRSTDRPHTEGWVLIADEFNQVLFLNPAMEYLGLRLSGIGKHINDIIPGLDVDVKERQGRMPTGNTLN